MKKTNTATRRASKRVSRTVTVSLSRAQIGYLTRTLASGLICDGIGTFSHTPAQAVRAWERERPTYVKTDGERTKLNDRDAGLIRVLLAAGGAA